MCVRVRVIHWRLSRRRLFVTVFITVFKTVFITVFIFVFITVFVTMLGRVPLILSSPKKLSASCAP